MSVDGHVHDARMHRREVPQAEGLGDDGRVGPQAGLYQVMGALASLGLAHDAGHYQVPLELHPRLASPPFMFCERRGRRAGRLRHRVSTGPASSDVRER